MPWRREWHSSIRQMPTKGRLMQWFKRSSGWATNLWIFDGGGAVRVIRWVVVLGLLAYGVWLRFDALADRHLWLDEALSWRLARLPFAEIAGRTSEATTVHPPLFFLLLHSWMKTVGESEWWLHVLSCLIGVAGIPAAYLAARNLVAYLSADSIQPGTASSAGCMAAVLFALNPFQAHLAQQVRGYTLAVFLCLLSTSALAGLLGAGSKRFRWGTFYVITATLACYTHHLAALTMIAQAIFALCWCYWPQRYMTSAAMSEEQRRPVRRGLWLVAITLLILLTPLALPLLRQTEAAADAWMRPIRGRDVPSELAEAFVLTSSSPARISDLVDIGSTLILGGVFLALIFAAGWPGRYIALLGSLPVWVLAVYSLLAARSLFDARYFAFAQVMWLVGGGILLSRIRFTPDRWAAGAIIAFWCLQLPWLQRPDDGPLQHGVRAALTHLREHAGEQDLIIAATPAVFFEASYYAREGPSVGLLSETKDRRLHEAAAHLNDQDLIYIKDVAEQSPSKIWILSMPAYDRAAERFLPSLDSYVQASKNSWRQDWNWERSVELVEYNRLGRKRGQEQARNETQ